jgi:hypothetical protein
MPMRALELEQAGKWRDALAAYRATLDRSLPRRFSGSSACTTQLGKRDSIVRSSTRWSRNTPREPMLRTVQLPYARVPAP